MENALVSLFKATSSITATVGQRIYGGFIPKKSYSHTNDTDRDGLPCILITEMSSDENVDLSATGALRFVDVDIDCKSRDRPEAWSLAKTVRQFLDDYTGSAGDETIDAVIMGPTVSDYEEPVTADDTGIHTVTMDVQIQYQES